MRDRLHHELRGYAARALVLVHLYFCGVAGASELPGAVAQQLAAAGLPASSLAFVVLRAKDGQELAGATPDRPMQPASTMKLLTSAVALDRLGLAWRGRAELLMRGSVKDGVLTGDLVLRGMGDADLDADALRRTLLTARDKGITEIRGDLLLVRDWMTPSRPELGLPPFDETPEFRYNVVPDAISLNTNLLQLDLVADATTVRLRSAPPLQGVTLASNLSLGDRNCDDWEDGWQLPTVSRSADGGYRIALNGEFPRNCTASTQVNVLDRNVFVDALFRAVWSETGGRFTGVTRDAAMPEGAIRIAEHRSRSLSELLRDINKRSDNPVTRLTFLALAGADEAGAGSGKNAPPSAAKCEASTERAAQVVRNWLTENGIDGRGIVLENGSGLSRIEAISPRQLAQVLRLAATRPWAPEYQASLPVAGIDGGMQRRLATDALTGRARLKTGTLRDVTALAGYLPGRDGKLLIVAAMINHPLASSKVARPILDTLMATIAASEPVSTAAPKSSLSLRASRCRHGECRAPAPQ